jgi:hypothetical protein
MPPAAGLLHDEYNSPTNCQSPAQCDTDVVVVVVFDSKMHASSASVECGAVTETYFKRQ